MCYVKLFIIISRVFFLFISFALSFAHHSANLHHDCCAVASSPLHCASTIFVSAMIMVGNVRFNRTQTVRNIFGLHLFGEFVWPPIYFHRFICLHFSFFEFLFWLYYSRNDVYENEPLHLPKLVIRFGVSSHTSTDYMLIFRWISSYTKISFIVS